MATFNSIWGDLEVRGENITPPAVSTPKKEPAAPSGADDDEEEEDAGRAPATPTPSSKDDESDEEEEYDFSDEDVSKAYTMLEEEGVLDLGPDDEFDNTPKGLADAVAITVKNKLEREIAAIPKVVQEFYSHVMEGKSPKEFNASEAGAQWATFELDTEDAEILVLEQLYRSQGMTEDEIEEEIQDITDADKRTKKAQKALDILVKQEETAQQDLELSAAKAQKEAQAAQLKEIEDLKKTIDSIPEIAGFALDDNKRKSFKEYLFKVNPRSGKTQMQENMSSEERRMTIAYLDFINYNKADLTREVATELTRERKKKLSKYTDRNVRNTNGSGVVKTKTNKASGSIVFPSIFGTQKIEIED